MRKYSKKKTSKPYTAADLAAVSDNPKWTKEDFAKAKRFDEAFHDRAASRRRRGRQKAPTKKQISLRLDVDVVETYKSAGPNWQTRMNRDLRKVLKLG
jgi:uncharacterized protein (DUF4415 family)